MNGCIRCFVAIELPEALRETIASGFAKEGHGVDGVRWTGAGNLHLTLKFLGDIVEDRLPALQEALPEAVAGIPPFVLELRGAGAFPSPQNPRVLFAEAGAGAAEAAALAAALDKALAPLGHAPESRRFFPHATVGRFKSRPRDSGALRRLLDTLCGRAWGACLVPAVHLVRSSLFPTGPIYSILRTTRLPDASRQHR